MTTFFNCYYCGKELPNTEPQIYFCDSECKNKYWKGQDVRPRKKSLRQIQEALRERGKSVATKDALAYLADNETYLEAKEIFGYPKDGQSKY